MYFRLDVNQENAAPSFSRDQYPYQTEQTITFRVIITFWSKSEGEYVDGVLWDIELKEPCATSEFTQPTLNLLTAQNNEIFTSIDQIQVVESIKTSYSNGDEFDLLVNPPPLCNTSGDSLIIGLNEELSCLQIQSTEFNLFLNYDCTIDDSQSTFPTYGGSFEVEFRDVTVMWTQEFIDHTAGGPGNHAYFLYKLPTYERYEVITETLEVLKSLNSTTLVIKQIYPSFSLPLFESKMRQKQGEELSFVSIVN